MISKILENPSNFEVGKFWWFWHFLVFLTTVPDLIIQFWIWKLLKVTKYLSYYVDKQILKNFLPEAHTIKMKIGPVP